MPTLHVRGVPEDIYESLVARARERDTSITSETIRLLRGALALDRIGQNQVLEAILAAREVRPEGSPTSAELIREDRDR